MILLRMHLRSLAQPLQVGVVLGTALSWVSRNATSVEGVDLTLLAVALVLLLVVLAHAMADRLARRTTAGTMRYCCHLPVPRRAVFFAPWAAGCLAVVGLGAFAFLCETTGLAFHAIERLHELLPRDLPQPKEITTLPATPATLAAFLGAPLFVFWLGAWTWQLWCASPRGRRTPTDSMLARTVSFASLPLGGALLVLLDQVAKRVAPAPASESESAWLSQGSAAAALVVAIVLAFAVLRRAHRLGPDDFPRGSVV